MVGWRGESNVDKSTQINSGLDLDQVQELRDQRVALIIDDDADTVMLLKIVLKNGGFNVVGANDGHEALSKCVETHPDVILLDLMMPNMDGWATMSQLKHLTEAPVIIISAVVEDDVVVRALDSGAVDYVRKPFSAQEVVARARNALREQKSLEARKVLVFPDWGLIIDLEARQVIQDDQNIRLSPLEFSVLKALAVNAPKPVSYDSLAEEVWQENSPRIRKRLKWIVYLLRQKLEPDPSRPQLIVNHTNFGYQFLG
ncbi:MAG: response regulator transcription factor [Anaerolineales bacterium]|jgi:two-component system KDP operon response regulator KdpE